MKFISTPLAGAFVIEPEMLVDERGFFARSFCQTEFRTHGLEAEIAQCNISFNKRRGTLRGLHYQAKPFEESKLVRSVAGSIWDVIVDMRPGSPTQYQWYAIELSAENRRSIYIPRGLAHGFQTLVDDTEVLYQMSESYHPESARGLRWDDPTLCIHWPIDKPVMSARDQSYPLLLRT